MMVSIEYNSDLSSQSKNIVIFVSSISQLKNLKIPLNLSFLINNIASVSWITKDGKNLFSKLHSLGAAASGARLID